MPGAIRLSQATRREGGKAHGLARLMAAGLRVPDGFCVTAEVGDADVLLAWRELGAERVAVRSSSQLEDGSSQSFAGQFETVLNVEGEVEVLAVARRILETLTGSVIIQRMVPARVAGVIFSLDPTAEAPCARVEAAAGLGERVVSGRVRPAAWRAWPDGRLEQLEGEPCLLESELRRLLQLAGQIAELLGHAADVEFAFEEGEEPWILQARAVTASVLSVADLRRREIGRAQALASPEGTVWSRYSLAESLPAPLPMTWSVVRRMLSLRGAYGRLYRELGYDPDPALEDQGVLDLICGRAYYNLSRESRLYFQDFPLVYRLEAMKADPRRASYPTPEVDIRAARPGFWWRLPRTVWKMFAAHYRQQALRLSFAHQLREQIAPAYLSKLRVSRLESLDGLGPADLRLRLERLLVLVVDDFAADSLKASALANLAMRGHRGPLPAARPDSEADLAGQLQRAARGELSFEQLLEGLGRRGPEEMELATPRWNEVPDRLRAELKRVSPRETAPRSPGGELSRWLALRETARHWLMLGWAELRRTLLALDQRLGLGGGVFWLHLDELEHPEPDLIAARRLERRLLLSLPCPAVLFSDDLEAIGRVQSAPSSEGLQGTALSWGSAEGEALVVQNAAEVPEEAQGFVLVCPSTDPGYTAVMTRAVALVVETGGVLSHGAIVARELALPAVSNIPVGALQSGQRLRVDGEYGRVTLL